MRKVYTILLGVVLSLFIISADKFSCQKNADLVNAGSEGGDDPYEPSYIEYYTIDGSDMMIRTAASGYGDGINEYLITTDMRTKDKIITDASLWIGYFQLDEEGHYAGNFSAFVVVNSKYFLDSFIPESDKARLSQWLGTPTKPNYDVFADPVVVYSEDAILGEDPYDKTYEFKLLTKAFYMPKEDVYGDGTRLIMGILNLPVYDYEAVLRGNPNPLTTINFKNTVLVKKGVPNFQ